MAGWILGEGCLDVSGRRDRCWEAKFQGSVYIWDLGQKALLRGGKAPGPKPVLCPHGSQSIAL